MSETISVKGLTKSYHGKTVLKPLDLSVKTGTVFGLLGANGAGKSTSIECMPGSSKADSGKVFLLDRAPKMKHSFFSVSIGNVLIPVTVMIVVMLFCTGPAIRFFR